jgi:hypothetical protein
MSGATNTLLSLNNPLLVPAVTINTVVDDMSPLPEPHIHLQRDPSPFQATLTLPQSSTSRPPRSRTYLFGLRTTISHSPLTFRESVTHTRSNRDGGDPMEMDRSSLIASSMSGPEEELLPPPEPSPTLSEVDTDLARFPPSPPKSERIQHVELEATIPPSEQINGTIALC